MPEPIPNRRLRITGIVFLTVLLDIAGFSVIFPLFPALLEHYLANEGEASLIGRTVAWLQAFASDDRNATVTLFGGLLGSLYAVMQFLFAPLWGALSDRVGRRPVLLGTLAGTALAHLGWVFAGSFATLVAARLFAGAMAGNIATASAVIADTTSGGERAKGMGMVGMAIGLGFILGPAFGGLTHADALALRHAWPGGAEFGINPFSTPALAACLLALVNLAWVARALPETRPPNARPRDLAASLLPLRIVQTYRQPGLKRVHLIHFVQLTAFASMEFTLTFLAAARLDYTVGDITLLFLWSGLLIAFVQGGIVRRVVPRCGERAVARAGLAIMLPGFVLVGAAASSAVLYAGISAMAIGSALVMPTLSALASRYAPADRQGLVQGTLRSMGSLSRAIGPILGGLAYWRLGSAVPYYAGAAVLLVPLWLTLQLPEVQE
jgi:MFS family permease